MNGHNGPYQPNNYNYMVPNMAAGSRPYDNLNCQPNNSAMQQSFVNMVPQCEQGNSGPNAPQYGQGNTGQNAPQYIQGGNTGQSVPPQYGQSAAQYGGGQGNPGQYIPQCGQGNNGQYVPINQPSGQPQNGGGQSWNYLQQMDQCPTLAGCLPLNKDCDIPPYVTGTHGDVCGPNYLAELHRRIGCSHGGVDKWKTVYQKEIDDLGRKILRQNFDCRRKPAHPRRCKFCEVIEDKNCTDKLADILHPCEEDSLDDSGCRDYEKGICCPPARQHPLHCCNTSMCRERPTYNNERDQIYGPNNCNSLFCKICPKSQNPLA